MSLATYSVSEPLYETISPGADGLDGLCRVMSAAQLWIFARAAFTADGFDTGVLLDGDRILGVLFTREFSVLPRDLWLKVPQTLN